MPSIRLISLITASILALTACNDDPTPSPSKAQEIEQTRLVATKMGESFIVDGCQVQAHRINVSGTLPSFTIVTANCPTAQVTTTQESCGKSCSSESIRIEPRTEAEGKTIADKSTVLRVHALRKQLDAMQQELRELESRTNR